MKKTLKSILAMALVLMMMLMTCAFADESNAIEEAAAPVVEEIVVEEPVVEEIVEEPVVEEIVEEPVVEEIVEEPVVEEIVEEPVVEEIVEEPVVEEVVEEPAPIIYTIKFIDWDESILRSFELEEGNLIENPYLNLTREGYTFSHWYLFGDVEKTPFEFDTPVLGEEIIIKIVALYNEIVEIVEETEVPEGEILIDIEDEEIPLAAPEREVLVEMLVGDTVHYGDEITLVATLVGYEGVAYTAQWQYNDGNGWKDIQGATELSHTFALDAENGYWTWQLVVTTAE